MSEIKTLDEAYSRGRVNGMEDAILDIKPTLDDYERRITALEVKWHAVLSAAHFVTLAGSENAISRSK